MARPKGIPCHPNTIAGAKKHNTGRAKNETGTVLTRRDIGIRYRKSHPERYTAEYRRDRRRKSDEGYRKTEEYKVAQSKYRGKDRYKNATLKFLYGISLQEKKSMKVAQKRLCGVCIKPLPRSLSKCFVDHNHETRRIRSLVHRRCNLILGFFEKTPEIAEQCMGYLQKHDGRKKKTCGAPPKAWFHDSQCGQQLQKQDGPTPR